MENCFYKEIICVELLNYLSLLVHLSLPFLLVKNTEREGERDFNQMNWQGHRRLMKLELLRPMKSTFPTHTHVDVAIDSFRVSQNTLRTESAQGPSRGIPLGACLQPFLGPTPAILSLASQRWNPGICMLNTPRTESRWAGQCVQVQGLCPYDAALPSFQNLTVEGALLPKAQPFKRKNNPGSSKGLDKKALLSRMAGELQF